MKLKIILILLPIFLFGQKKIDNLIEINFIKSHVKYVDSISSFTPEEIQSIYEIPGHAKINGEPTTSSKINTRILKYSNEILRINYNQTDSKEFWIYYYYNTKPIYVELFILRGKKNLFNKKRFYFQNQNITPLTNLKSYDDIREEVKVFIKANELLKSING